MSDRRPRGTGNVFVKHGSYYGKWYARGQRVTRKIGPVRLPGSREGLTKAMAEKRLQQMMQDSDAAPPPVAERMTVADVGARLVTHLTVIGRKPSYLSSVESHLRVHLAPFFTGAIADITEADVERFIAQQRNSGRAVQSVRTDVRVLSRTINYAIKQKWATFNPVGNVEKPRDPHAVHEVRYLEPEEVEALLRAVRDTHRYGPVVRERVHRLAELHRQAGSWKAVAERLGVTPPTITYYQRITDPDALDAEREQWRHHDVALYTTAAFAGLRQGELIALRWRDVDWTNQVLRVSRNFAHGQFGTTKGGRERQVPMADRVGAALDQLSRASAYTGRDDLVFGHPLTGHVRDRSNLLRGYKRTLKRAGLDERPFHNLRHTFGTMVARSGAVSLRDLQEWMGHADIETTMRYAAFMPRSGQATQLNRAFGLEGSATDPITDPKLSETQTHSEIEKPTETGDED